MIQYELIENEIGSYVWRTNEDGTFTSIPLDPANADYQEYLNPSAQSKEITTPQGGNE